MADVTVAERAVSAPPVFIEASCAPLGPEQALRIVSFEGINPRVVTELPRATVETLTASTDIATKTVQILEQFGGDKTKAVEQLGLLLQNSDLVDVITRIDPVLLEATMPLLWHWIEDWKGEQIARLTNPAHPLPSRINDLVDKEHYLTGVTPLRPISEEVLTKIKEDERGSKLFLLAAHYAGFPITEELVDEWTLSRWRVPLASLTEPAYRSLLEGAKIALDLAGDSPNLQQQAVSGIIKTIRAQEKWWVIGEDGIDPLTHDLLQLLIDNHVPDAVSILLDTLYRKVEQDATYIHSMMFPSPEFLFHYGTTLGPALDWFAEQAIKADKVTTQRYIGDHLRDSSIASLVSKLFLDRPELHDEVITLGKAREAEYFGKKFFLQGLPHGEEICLREYVFGIVAAENNTGEFLGFFYVNPAAYPVDQKIVAVEKTPPEELLFWSSRHKKSIPPEELDRFHAEYPELVVTVGSYLYGRSYATQPLPAYYQLWEYMVSLSEEGRTQLNQFMEEYGPMAIFPFLTGEHGKENIPKVIKFVLVAQQPREYLDENEIHHLRAYESFTEELLQAYANLSCDAWGYAASITPIPEQMVQIRDLVLQRAKALLIAAAKIHESKGFLTRDDEEYIKAAFVFHRLFLTAMADPTHELAQSMNMSYDVVREFFRFHDPNDPDSRALFNSSMELWFEIYMNKQNLADYRGKVEELTIEFYQAYEELEKDCAATTADPVLERKRDEASLLHDIESGVLPEEATPEHPVTIGFAGIGNGRMEKILVDFLKQNVRGYRFIGIDINRPNNLPPDIEFHRMNMKDLGKKMPGKFRRLMLIWSPFMDVIELEEMLEIAESLALACEEGDPQDEKSQPIIELDVHFPFGKHSYEKILREFQAAHPDEPFGLMYRDFERVGKPPVGKLFFASDPALINWIFGLYGFEIINLPKDPKEIDALCQKASEDDGFIPEGPQDDLDKQAVYRTTSGMNRITYKLRRKPEAPSIESILAIRRKLAAH